MTAYLVISNLRIHNANAASSLYTIGFPAMTAWLGSMHALQRKMQRHSMSEVHFTRLAVSCKECDVQVYRGKGDYVNSVIGTANPLKKKGGGYERPPFIEEPRCHLNVSLLIETQGVTPDNEKAFLTSVCEVMPGMKIAGGDILSERFEDDAKKYPRQGAHLQLAYFTQSGEKNHASWQGIIRALMPGFVLVERSHFLQSLPGRDSMDKLLNGLAVQYDTERDDEGKVTEWKARKLHPAGWIVPIAVGFQAITPAMKAPNQRDESCEHHFAEPVVTLGEFKMPIHFHSLDEMMWAYEVDQEKGLYLCKNRYEELQQGMNC